jgi:hypothetical protein
MSLCVVLAGCTKPPTAQDVAGVFAGLKCGADIYVVEKAATSKADTAANVANGAMAAGDTLSNDAACKAAIAAGAARLETVQTPPVK